MHDQVQHRHRPHAVGRESIGYTNTWITRVITNKTMADSRTANPTSNGKGEDVFGRGCR